MKQITSAAVAIVLLTFGSSGWAAGALKVEPGLWKTSMTLRHGATAGPPQIRTHCVTPKDINDFVNGLMLKSTNSADENCRRTSFHESSSVVDWKYECTGKVTLSRSGSIKFDTPSHYTGLLNMTGNIMGQMLDESSIMEGNRLGACAPKEGTKD